MKINIDIETPGHHFKFTGIIHTANKEQDLLLSPEKFYIPFRPEANIPSFPHQEIEIISDLSGLEYSSKLHIHTSEINNKRFVCWTEDIKTIEDAKKVFRLWSIGSVYTLITGEDFAQVFYQAKTHDTFLLKMASEYKIVFSKKRGLTKGRVKI